ncbi:MAG: long-chain fatty acid--CoA ligase [Coleofasciculaceae cyanobacterium SM2_1_6]|nr:long-chain fatty acid--CoA ligase [Coleofasciculaceae cyanobacterium SM2_1_6]
MSSQSLPQTPVDFHALSQYPEEQANFRNLIATYKTAQCLSQVWQSAAEKFSDIPALLDNHNACPMQITFREMWQQICQFAAGLQARGVNLESQDPQIPTRIALFADNSARWFIADQGIMAAGAVNAVRSSQADRAELLYILANSGSTALVVEDLKTLRKLLPELLDFPLSLVVLLTEEEIPADLKDLSIEVLNFAQLMTAGKNYPFQMTKADRSTLATLIYTSGTGGQPKSVMLTHGNLLHQVNTFGGTIILQPGDLFVSILPSWHSYERACEYFVLSQGCTQIYTNIRQIKADLKKYRPHLMVGVPRLWENIYEGVQRQLREQPANKQKLVSTFFGWSQSYIKAKRLATGLDLNHLNPSVTEKLGASLKAALLAPLHSLGKVIVYKKILEATGGRVKIAVSGGGSLAMHLEDFFEIIGFPIVVGYGLTETSPVTHVRRPWHNLRGASGLPLPGTEIKIVDPETRASLPRGERGLVLLRGPQIMRGYYQNPEATKAAIDPQGWFNSGDLGMITPAGDIVITGRAKDTIVLTNGENIEPLPIEDACLRSPYIDQIMLVGQDQRSLGALIVPNQDALKLWITQQNLSLQLPEDLASKPIQDLFRQELNREVKNRSGYRGDDRIGVFRLITEPFTMENGMLTQTLKTRRPVIAAHYQQVITEMFQ